MTKHELLSNSVFQKARDDAFIYFVAWFDGGPWIRYVTVPKKNQTRDCIRFRSSEPLISKKTSVGKSFFSPFKGR